MEIALIVVGEKECATKFLEFCFADFNLSHLCIMEYWGWPLFQIFSVSIHLKDQDNVFVSSQVNDDGSIQALTDYLTSKGAGLSECGNSVKLCGTIKVRDGDSTSFVYDRPKENPETLDNTPDTITLIGDPIRCPVATAVDVLIDLIDADHCLQISRGFITFHAASPQILYNRRLSAVIKGDHGCWATVYYSLLERAIQANIAVKINIKGECGAALSVIGGLFVRYGSYGYDYEYEKKHYRTVLFKRSPSNELRIDGKEVILPLLVPMVAVPLKDSMIVDVDLHVMSCGSEVASVCSSSEKILPSVTPTRKNIVGTNIDIEITVTWSDYR